MIRGTLAKADPDCTAWNRKAPIVVGSVVQESISTEWRTSPTFGNLCSADQTAVTNPAIADYAPIAPTTLLDDRCILLTKIDSGGRYPHHSGCSRRSFCTALTFRSRKRRPLNMATFAALTAPQNPHNDPSTLPKTIASHGVVYFGSVNHPVRDQRVVL